jgi:heat shock protein HslJ
MMFRAALAATAATLSLGGCITMQGSHPLTGTEWRLTRIEAAGATTALSSAMQGRHRVAFREDGALEARLDCNRGRGTWTAGQPRSGAGAINIGPLASTRMACAEPHYGTQLASALGEARRFALAPGRGELVIEAPGMRLTFAPAG